MRRAFGWVTLALALAGCTEEPPLASGPGCAEAPSSLDPTDSPRLDEVWQIATHNSYWVNRGVPGDAFASGTEERFVDQVLVDHARSLEIDVHPDPAHPGELLVFHTTPGDSLCDTLPSCLALLRAVDHALPEHEPITIVVELKAITGGNFDETHGFADLDRALSDGLGERLYRPRDLLARCADRGLCADTLADCAAALGFPTLDELRGRYLVALIGNWDDIGAHATADWARYATTATANRVAFPMMSSWKLRYDELSPDVRELISSADLDRAVAESAFAQIEDTADPRLSGLVARHALVRIDGANSVVDQEARIGLGATLLQTDTPWVQARDAGPVVPMRLFDASAAPVREPGERAMLLPADGARERVFAYVDAGSAPSTATWEATMGSGPSAEAVGCLRAATALGAPGEESIEVCRVKTAALRIADMKGSPDAESVRTRVVVCHAGACTTDELAPPAGPSAPANLVALAITPKGVGACAEARVASSIAPMGEVDFSALGTPVCFDAPLRYQGIARTSADAGETAPAHVVGLRRGGAFFDASKLTVVLEPPSTAANPAPKAAPDRLVVP